MGVPGADFRTSQTAPFPTLGSFLGTLMGIYLLDPPSSLGSSGPLLCSRKKDRKSEVKATCKAWAKEVPSWFSS